MCVFPSLRKYRYQQPRDIVRPNVQIYKMAQIFVDPCDLRVRELSCIWHEQQFDVQFARFRRGSYSVCQL